MGKTLSTILATCSLAIGTFFPGCSKESQINQTPQEPPSNRLVANEDLQEAEEIISPHRIANQAYEIGIETDEAGVYLRKGVESFLNTLVDHYDIRYREGKREEIPEIYEAVRYLAKTSPDSYAIGDFNDPVLREELLKTLETKTEEYKDNIGFWENLTNLSFKKSFPDRNREMWLHAPPRIDWQELSRTISHIEKGLACENDELAFYRLMDYCSEIWEEIETTESQTYSLNRERTISRLDAIFDGPIRKWVREMEASLGNQEHPELRHDTPGPKGVWDKNKFFVGMCGPRLGIREPLRRMYGRSYRRAKEGNYMERMEELTEEISRLPFCAEGRRSNFVLEVLEKPKTPEILAR